MKPETYPPLGSSLEMFTRVQLRAQLNSLASELWSEQLRELLATARLMRCMGYPIPHDPQTVAALFQGVNGASTQGTDSLVDPRPQSSQSELETLERAREDLAEREG